MAIEIKTPIANRYGMDVKIWSSGTDKFEDAKSAVASAGLTVEVSYDTFIAKVEQAAGISASYEFKYFSDETTWKLDEEAVTLADYGVIVTGEPEDTNTITVSIDLAPAPLALIDFANITDIAIEGDSVSATGGQAQRAMVDFDNPLSGTLTISTQLMNAQLLTLLAGKDISTASTTIDFETVDGSVRRDYVITADTVWKDKSGNVYSEKLIAFKALPQRAFNMSHQGEGDPTSTDIVFDLQENEAGKCLRIILDDKE